MERQRDKTLKRNTGKIPAIVRLLRPNQWIKNCIVFLPIVFSGRFLDISIWATTLIATLCFCLASSGIYCLNDVMDRNSDSLDPEKFKRPVASGKVGIYEALSTGVSITILSIILSFIALPSVCTITLVLYLVINILYCLWLKHIMLIDVLILALGFVLRIVMGGLAADIWLSQWIIIMIFLLALFLALAKRRHEVVITSICQKKVEKVLLGIHSLFLTQLCRC